MADMLTVEERFWDKVYKTDGCWYWAASCKPRGYGWFRAWGRVHLAHRVAYMLTHGRIGDGEVVMHLCDNPMCVRPEHLRLGTQQENVEDMVRKGRARNGAMAAKLSA